ncbi:MAG: hypothetical protein ACTHK7_14475 [Aureliella sp.]
MMQLARIVSLRSFQERSRCRSLGAVPPGLLALCLLLMLGSIASAQYEYEGGTILTKDLGDGSLRVRYFNEESASGIGGRLHVEVSCPKGPSKQDRNLEIVLYANFLRGGPKDGIEYRLPVRLPEGAGRTEVTLPYNSPGQSSQPGSQSWVMLWDVGVFEEGRDVAAIRTYSGSRSRAAPITVQVTARNTYHFLTSNSAPWSMLRLVSDAPVPTSRQPELHRLLTATESDPNIATTYSFTGKTEFGISSDLHNVSNIRSLSTAPEDWMYYLQFNYVALDQALLENMRKQRPSVAQALKQYVAAGGSVLLIGYARPKGRKQLHFRESVDQWLGDSSASADTSDSKDEASKAGAKAEWTNVVAPVEAWWQRSLNNSAATSLPVDPYASPPTPMPAPGSVGTPTALRPPDDPQSTAAAGDQAITQVDASSAAPPSKKTREGGALSLGGCARDLLTGLETYSMAQYGTPVIIVDKWIEVVTGYGGPQVMSQGGYYAPGAPSEVIEVEEFIAPLRKSLERSVAELQSHDTLGCQWRTYGLGAVGTVEPNLNAVPLESLSELAKKLSDSASMRINSTQDNGWALRNIINSVGRPPVWTFCGFVLLFGLLLGPGLLVFTGWMGRRSLLIFLVPFASIVATSLIVAFEVLHEGFDTNIRITSLQTIDEPTGEGFAWSRQTYFSGWPPREGLVFPRGVYFRPVSANPDQSAYEDPRRAVGSYIEFADGEVRWTGWLRAREQQQLLIGHPAKPMVPVRAGRVDARHAKLTNLTAERLPFAVVRDEADGSYLATALDPGAEVTCEARTAYDVGLELARIRANHIPVPPPEMQAGSAWRWNSRFMPYGIQSMTTDMLDSAWQSYLSENLELPPGGFVALEESSDAVYVPLKGNFTECKHLIVGRLVW